MANPNEATELSVVRNNNLPATSAEIKANVNLIQHVMHDVMKDGTHFGKIPGCGDSPTLLKPGAEKIMATFRLAADPEIEDLSTDDECRYRVKTRLISPSGVFVGAGIGECSSGEEKYKWRRTYIDEEFNETPEDQRREKWIKPYNKQAFKQKQVRTNPADLRNTILKMAKKRSLVDGVLTATAASDIFTQDIEDMPAEIREGMQEDHRPAGVRDMEADSPQKAALVKKLETAAAKGWETLQTEWSANLSDEERKIVGADFGRIKKIAEGVK